MTIRLHKLHATGNDFLVLVDLEEVWGGRGSDRLGGAIRRALCDRHRGIGADGLIRLLPASAGSDCGFELSNADGGFAEMSGNGMRCLAWVANRSGLAPADTLVVDTAAGLRPVTLTRDDNGEVVAADVGMGAVSFHGTDVELAVDGTTYRGDIVDVGNPHFVAFVDHVAAVPLEQHGPIVEHDGNFPNRTNFEVAAPGDGGLEMRVWERGAGITLSCGTGACAVAAAGRRRGLVSDRATVRLPGGELTVALDGDTVRLAGPVAHVFDVEVDPDRLLRTSDERITHGA
jgi:diaminopimelate epimerase